MELGLKGKVALVSGASGGIGLAIATALASEGAHVAICARGQERLSKAQALLIGLQGGGEVAATPLDIRDVAPIRAWVDQSAARWGGLHIVVTNGGGPPPGPPGAFDLDAYRSALELCFLSHVALVQAAAPYLRAAGWGRILIVASETVRQPTVKYGLSSATRPGLVGFAKSFAQELGASGVTVNVLAPGYHRTPTVEQMAYRAGGGDVEHGLALLSEHIPLKRMGRSEELGAVVAFLASHWAGFIHGAVIPVDGGATLGY